jgi:regulation of enolase protein 1 (concanavalin A-like superfamily)
MNLTLHIIRKDLRTLRWLVIIWVVACLTHLGLRLAQYVRSDAASLTPFWRSIESTQRWDYAAVFVLPIFIIPLVLHLDPMRGRLSFWKTVPIGRKRLLAAKLATILALFVLLPLACEAVYFSAAGLLPVFGAALGDWSRRFLPGIAAVVLGCLFTRSLRIGAVGIVALLCVAASACRWPFGQDAVRLPLHHRSQTPDSISAPPGAQIEVLPKTAGFSVKTTVSGNKRTEVQLGLSAQVRIEGLPEGIVVSSIALSEGRLALGERIIEGRETFGGTMSENGVPVEESYSDVFRNANMGRPMVKGVWSVKTGALPIASKDIPAAGADYEGKLLVALARKRGLVTLPIREGAQWQPGLHRLTVSNADVRDTSNIRFTTTLATILADPRGDSGGLALTRNSHLALWIEHDAQLCRTLFTTISSAAWRTGSDRTESGDSGNVDLQTRITVDITRSRKRADFTAGIDARQMLRETLAPLALARLLDERANLTQWHLAAVAYDELGTVVLPVKWHLAKPPTQQDNGEEGKPALPELGLTLAQIAVPPHPGRAEAQHVFERLAGIASGHAEEALRKHENELMRKLAALGPENLEVLLAAAVESVHPNDWGDGVPARYGGEWLIPWREPDAFWRRVLQVACDLARPEDKALVLRYHSPDLDLLRAIEPQGWEVDALPAMCATALRTRVPPAWQDLFARHPETRTRAAVLAQIRQRNVAPVRVADFVASGLLPAREAASELWETVVASTGDLEELTPAFPFAVKQGVEIIPRDLLRLLRLGREDIFTHTGTPFKTAQSSFAQSFSLRSDCPPTVAEALSWLEQNVRVLQFNDATGRYELPGKAAPAQDFSAWGRFIDPLGAGRARLDDTALVLTSAGYFADYYYSEWNRSAPRLMREVEGDFTMEVTIQPTINLAPAWSGRAEQIFQGAGLLVDAGEQRWIRWEQSQWNTSPPILREETLRGGKGSTSNRANKLWDSRKPVRLRVSRHDDLFATAWKQGDGEWVESPAAQNFGWPRKVRVGPLVVNGVTHPFTTRFTDLNIVPSSAAPTALATPIVAHPGAEATPTGTHLAGWGVVENPVGAGVFKIAGDTLSIKVTPKIADYYIQERLTAPHVLNEVEGDFTLEALIAPTAKKDWTSAELLLAAGSDFYFRIGLASLRDNAHFAHYAERGKRAETVNLDAVRDLAKPIRLRLQRRGWLLTVAHQQEGGEWTEFYPINLRAWPAKIQAGVIALNTSGEPFTAIFSGFKLTRDKPTPP